MHMLINDWRNRSFIVMLLVEWVCMSKRSLFFRMECWRESHWVVIVRSPLFLKDFSFFAVVYWVDEVWA